MLHVDELLQRDVGHNELSVRERDYADMAHHFDLKVKFGRILPP